MKYLLVNKIITATLLFLLSQMAARAQFPAPTTPPRLVNDFTETLPLTSVNDLENHLVQFANETSTQIAVVMVSDLSGYAASDYAFRLAEAWGIGTKGKNNGILILVKPKVGNQKGKAFIATGYGLEGAVPDAVARRIVDNEMIPLFRKNDYYGGIQAGANVLMELTRGEYTADAYLEKNSADWIPLIGVLFFIIIIVIVSVGNKAGKISKSSLGHDIPFWVLMSMLGSESRKHNGGWGNFSSGSGGFGGGSFGGGGAGGSW
ncbi:MAG: TPM domain-containing protein [Cytophagaceae bacterium]|jgi:uncharacterized protein|nr:TPM domain-containing protein [Cytophagaceae bacterium]